MQNTHKKICIVSISLGKGGAERSCAMLSRMLHEKGHEVHVAILNDEVQYNYAGSLFNLGLLKKNNDQQKGRIKRMLKLRKYIKKHRFDLIIDHRTKNLFQKELFYAKVIYKGVPRIYVLHSARESLYMTEKPKKFKKILNKNLANVAVSNYIKELVLKANGVNNGLTIHNAYDPAWRSQQSALPPILDGKEFIVSYGRIDDSVKDIRFLIKAFHTSELWKQNINLVILGDGPDKANIAVEVQLLECASHILFISHNTDPFSIVSKAKYVTLTSNFEGFPMVLIEALSLGVPVVSLDIVSGPSEIIQHEKNGLLVPTRDVSLFAEAMQRFFKDAILYERCRENADSSIENYSFNQIAEKWHQLVAHGIH